MVGMASTPLTELMLTMLPPPWAAITRATAWPMRKEPLRITRTTSPKSPSEMQTKWVAGLQRGRQRTMPGALREIGRAQAVAVDALRVGASLEQQAHQGRIAAQ